MVGFALTPASPPGPARSQTVLQTGTLLSVRRARLQVPIRRQFNVNSPLCGPSTLLRGFRPQRNLSYSTWAPRAAHDPPADISLRCSTSSLSRPASAAPALRSIVAAVARSLGRALLLYAALAVASSTALSAPTIGAAGRASPAFIKQMLGLVLNFDEHLATILAEHGRLTYGFLFAIVFCETGLVITPFLPGDSLLFVAGTFASSGGLKLQVLLVSLFIAAVLGDSVNYFMGSHFGIKLFNHPIVQKVLNEDHLRQTEKFYDRHGKRAGLIYGFLFSSSWYLDSLTVVLARFLPIIRTVAPFVAGIGSMDFPSFMLYNVLGGLLWVFGFCGLGYFFGNLEWVHKHLSAVILGIIVLSCIPPVLEILHARKERKKAHEQS